MLKKPYQHRLIRRCAAEQVIDRSGGDVSLFSALNIGRYIRSTACINIIRPPRYHPMVSRGSGSVQILLLKSLSDQRAKRSSLERMQRQQGGKPGEFTSLVGIIKIFN